MDLPFPKRHLRAAPAPCGTPRMIQHSPEPVLAVPSSPWGWHWLRGTPGPGCSWSRRLWPQTCLLVLQQPCAGCWRDEAGAGLSSALHLPPTWTHHPPPRSFLTGMKILLGLKMAGLSTKQQNNLHLFLS